MFSLFFKKKYVFLYAFSILLSSCYKNDPVIGKAYRGTQNSNNYLAYLTKIEANQSVKIACEGTSLTYGQNEPGVLPPINGAGQSRALYQYPSSLQIALR